jgi:hypothetical protein
MRMLPFVIAASLLAQTAASSGSPSTSPTKTPARLKVLVLDVSSTDLTESERTTLTNLEAAQLSENTRLEVLSGEDIKQLVKLQGQAQDLGVDGNCTDACMAELAGALGAGVVVATQAGKLGDTLIVTLVVFDAAKAKSVSRKSVQASSLGELPSKLGPALDALVQPLLPALPQTAMPVVAPSPPPPAPVEPPKPKEMSPRLRELYDVEAMGICFDPANRAAWWFCNRKQGFTENAFAREYEKVTGLDDLRRADFHRGGDLILPSALVAAGAFGFGMFIFTMACGTEDGACGLGYAEAIHIDESDGGPLAIGLGGALTGLFATMGGVMLFSELGEADGALPTHILTEGEASGAIDRYNGALKGKLARDLGE